MLGLFLGMMKITVVIESLSITKPNLLQRESSTINNNLTDNQSSFA